MEAVDLAMQSNLNFRLMAIEFWLRDRFDPPVKILRDAGIKPGMKILDLGCGPGGFSLAAAGLAGPEGHVYAVDIQPLALRMMQKACARKGFANLSVLHASQLGEVRDQSLDMALLYDVLHDLDEPMIVLKDIRRLLRPGGLISVKDHHLSAEQTNELMTADGLFREVKRSARTGTFERA